MNISRKMIKIYRADNNKEPFSEWISSLAVKERARIFARLDRVETGHMGDHKSLGGEYLSLDFILVRDTEFIMVKWIMPLFCFYAAVINHLRKRM